MSHDPDTALGGPRDRFPSTRASLVALASGQPHELRREALGEIAAVYWKPVYKYIRLKWKRSNEDAKDLTQGFFAALIEKEWVERFDPAKASFRTWLRLCIDGYVGREAEAAGRLKRGGAVRFTGWEFDEAEREIAVAAAPGESPEDWFLREWQRAMFAAGLAELRRACLAEGREAEWAIFEAYDLAEGDRPRYEDLARRFGLPVTTVTNYLARSRRELRKCVLGKLHAVTAGDRDYREEARRLFG